VREKRIVLIWKQVHKKSMCDEPNILVSNFVTFFAKKVYKLPKALPGWEVLFVQRGNVNHILPRNEITERIVGIEVYNLIKQNEKEGFDERIYLRAERIDWTYFVFGIWILSKDVHRPLHCKYLTKTIDWVLHNGFWDNGCFVYLKTCKNDKKFL
jgi:hypothetical protein